MAIYVSQLIGSPQVAGVKVQHMGTFRRDAALLGGAVAGVGAGEMGSRIAAGRSQAVPANTPEYKTQRAYLALTDKDLVLVSMKAGVVSGLEPVAVVARVPRGDVVSAKVGKRVAPPLTITLADGEIWQFEIPNPGFLAIVPSLNTRKTARHLAVALVSGAAVGA